MSHDTATERFVLSAVLNTTYHVGNTKENLRRKIHDGHPEGEAKGQANRRGNERRQKNVRDGWIEEVCFRPGNVGYKDRRLGPEIELSCQRVVVVLVAAVVVVVVTALVVVVVVVAVAALVVVVVVLVVAVVVVEVA